MEIMVCLQIAELERFIAAYKMEEKGRCGRIADIAWNYG
jgi:hypothetical protein